MHASNYPRVIKELCALIGFADHNVLLKGGKLQVDDYRISFIFNICHDPKNLLVYVDMGTTAGDPVYVYETLLKINFELGIGRRGLISMHPQTRHLFYSFAYLLDDTASGRALLDTLLRFSGDIAFGAIDLLPPRRAFSPARPLHVTQRGVLPGNR
jgi:hypothetical protein